MVARGHVQNILVELMKEKMGSSQNASQWGCISYKHNEIEKYNLTINQFIFTPLQQVTITIIYTA